MNVTIPGRLHLIVRRSYVWFTIWLFGRRFHIGPRLGDGAFPVTPEDTSLSVIAP